MSTQELRYQKQLSGRQQKISGSGSARSYEYTLLKENYMYLKRKIGLHISLFFFFFLNELY